MIITPIQKEKLPPKKGCTYCGTVYNRKDFSVCPSCGGDGGGFTEKVWKPSKAQRKEYAKKQNTAG